jgi:transcriptional regulator with XRE-family HTH domain
MGRPDRAHDSEGKRTPEQAFGLTLRRIRLNRGLSQQALADKSGYHRTYIGLLEGGHKSPSLRTIFNVATTLQVKPSEIVKEVERLIVRTERRAAKADHSPLESRRGVSFRPFVRARPALR